MSAETLPALESTRTPTATPIPANTVPSVDPGAPAAFEGSADELDTVAGQRDLQNFAGDHEKATTIGVVVAAPPSVPGDLPDSLSPEAALAYLRAILQRVREVEAAIDGLVGVDPFQEGEAEDLRREIYRRLLRAAEPYRPYAPAKRGG